jgi:hypothetical protein
MRLYAASAEIREGHLSFYVESFNMGGFTGFLAHFFVGSFGDTVVRFPKVRETGTAQVLGREFAPQPLARFHQAVAGKERKYLPRAARFDDPNASWLIFI